MQRKWQVQANVVAQPSQWSEVNIAELHWSEQSLMSYWGTEQCLLLIILLKKLKKHHLEQPWITRVQWGAVWFSSVQGLLSRKYNNYYTDNNKEAAAAIEEAAAAATELHFMFHSSGGENTS